MTIEAIREKIDALDAKIIELLDKRAAAGMEIAKAKQVLDLPAHDPNRERAILARLAGKSDGTMPAKSLQNIYRVIMAETLALEMNPPARPGSDSACADRLKKKDILAEVVENIMIAPGFCRMRIRTRQSDFFFAPGQFFQLRIIGDGKEPFLRRPFAPMEAGQDNLTFVYAVVGSGTARMAALAPGAQVGVLAPLGKPYDLPPAGTTALLIGGGCGSPSLVPLARQLHDAGIRLHVIVGARSADILLEHRLYADMADRLLISTDDGSSGCKGTVLHALKQEEERNKDFHFDRIYACGPAPMLKGVAALAAERSIPCQVSLEERMACGFGACMGCVVPVKDEAIGKVYRRVCHDGPVFDASTLAWEDMR